MAETEQLYQPTCAAGAAGRRLQEAANCAEWMESRLHLMFTEIADTMFGDGFLSRDERIALSGAIGDALDGFRGAVEAKASQLYQRGRWEMPDMPHEMPMEESGELAGMFVPLIEKAVRRDGTIPIKVIAPGWGASGYYPVEVLERDGPKLFATGTQMFWDHQTAQEEAERPEGSLDNLAAVLVAPARWDAQGMAGPGLYADAKVFENYRQSVDSLAPHIGVSIRANGRAQQGEAEGRTGPIVQSIASVKSIDFVTKPGAGGQIIQMFEAARPARRIEQQEKKMDEKQQRELKEAQEKLATLEAQNARLQEALVLRDANDFVAGQLAASSLPDVTKRRLGDRLAAKPPVVNGALDKDAYATQIAETIRTETEYLQQVAGYGAGRIEGMGNTAVTNQDTAGEMTKRMTESFRALGLSEKEANIAASGRVR